MHEIMPFIFNLDSNNQFKFKQIEKPINMPSEKHIGSISSMGTNVLIGSSTSVLFCSSSKVEYNNTKTNKRITINHKNF